MLAQRAMQVSARRLLLGQHAVSTGQMMGIRRTVTTQSGESEILIKQRLNRPVAPHLTIYEPQITWYPSMFHRLTGVALSGPLYLFSIAYLAAPYLGWHLESTVLATSFAAWPIAAKAIAKTTIALPFVFHSFNGIRHLAWDLRLGFSKVQVARTGWFVIALSAVTSLYLGLAY
ncbi:mitochondrial succinate dehydrogenase subunit C [Microthyrium microscopicum]|uniref:Mitochondrial succinate dehydrogenase subunit C n=1 Tax=Microthyrium microscopicum TaxID=703497 RepID=A0A6A6URS9_9PEZI|nr:mitochondrial succinate dehydrogenase subunit C [Microthyrium microscopicum]